MKKLKYFIIVVLTLLIMPVFARAESVITVINQGSESDYKITDNYGWTFNFKNTKFEWAKTNYLIETIDQARTAGITIARDASNAEDSGYYKRSKNYAIKNKNECSNGNIWMLYKNVGMYQGKTVNLKVTVKSCDPYTVNYTPNIGFSLENMQFIMNGLHSVNLEYNFIDDEGTPIDIKGYGTFTDLDNTQAFQMGTGIDKAYIYETYKTCDNESECTVKHLYANRLVKKGVQFPDELTQDNIGTYTTNTENAVQSSKRETSSPDKFAWTTVLFSGGKFNLSYYTGAERGMYVFSPNSLVPFAIEDPVKNVNKEVVSKAEEYTYTVSHRVPYITLDGSNNSYTAYSFNDVLEPCLGVTDASKIVIKNDEGTDVTQHFDIKLNNSNGSVVVDATAKSDFLANNEFYGHEYEFMINTYVKDNYDLSKYLNNDKTKYIIPNQAKVSVTDNGGTAVNKDTNTVNVYITIPKEIVSAPNTGKYTSIALIAGGVLIIAIAIITLITYKKKSNK